MRPVDVEGARPLFIPSDDKTRLRLRVPIQASARGWHSSAAWGYEGKLRGGKILVSVHTDDKKDQDRAKTTLEDADADDTSAMSAEVVAKA
jgi:hypothetical protein